jgi:hypothetical protein
MRILFFILLTVSFLTSCNYQKPLSEKNKGYEVEIDYGEYEDSVEVSKEHSSLIKDSNGMITLALKSSDLLYKIKVFPKLIKYVSQNQQYKFVWKRYQINKKQSTIDDNRPDAIDLHCWKNLVDTSGKEIILSGDDPLPKGFVDPECMVDVVIVSLDSLN